MYKIEENDPNEPTIADREAAEKALRPFCLHASVDLVEYVALAIKSERSRCTEIFASASDAQLALLKNAEQEIERDRAKAEAQRAEQNLKILMNACREVTVHLRDLERDPETPHLVTICVDLLECARQEIA